MTSTGVQMIAAAATAVEAKMSWATIVKGAGAAEEGPGDDDDQAIVPGGCGCGTPPEPRPLGGSAVRPGAKGSTQAECLCRGKLLVMLGYYGWILPLDDIDHPDVKKNGGRIYVRKRDFPWGTTPIEGDVVAFYLYADSQGLGAERCRLEGRGAASAIDGGGGSQFVFNAAAAEFVPSASDSDDESDQSACEFPFAFAPLATEPPVALEAPPGLRAPPGLPAPPGLSLEPQLPPGLQPIPAHLFRRPWASKAASREPSQDGSTSADGSNGAGVHSDSGGVGSSRSASPAAAKDAAELSLPPWRRTAPWHRATEDVAEPSLPPWRRAAPWRRATALPA